MCVGQTVHKVPTQQHKFNMNDAILLCSIYDDDDRIVLQLQN